MADINAHVRWIAFPLFFLALWLAITTLLTLLSGWYGLMRRYPDAPAASPVGGLRLQSGSMRGVGMRNLLDLTVCEQGLRVAMLRVFSPFGRPFFVPWNDIVVSRRRSVVWPRVVLRLGDRHTLTLAADTADCLARAAGPLWPETEPVPTRSRGDVARRLATEWVFSTAGAAAFFTFVTFLAMPAQARLPMIPIDVLFPAVLLGVGALMQFWLQRDR